MPLTADTKAAKAVNAAVSNVTNATQEAVSTIANGECLLVLHMLLGHMAYAIAGLQYASCTQHTCCRLFCICPASSCCPSQQHSFAISSGTPLSVVTLLGAFIQPGFPFCLFNFRLFKDPSWDLTLRKVLFNTATVCSVLLSCAGTQKIADAVNGTLKALGMKSGATGSSAGVVSILAFFAMLFVLAF